MLLTILDIVDIVMKASVILAMTALVAAALRRASASTRHFVWTLGMLGALAAPALSAALPRWELPIVRLQAVAAQVPTAVVDDRASAMAPPFRGQTPSASAADAATTDEASAPEGSDSGRSVTHSLQLALTSASWTMILPRTKR